MAIMALDHIHCNECEYMSPHLKILHSIYSAFLNSTVGLLGGLIASGQVMMAIPYSPGLGTKQMMWLANCGMIGLVVAPVGIFGGAIALRAAWYTADCCSLVNLISTRDKSIIGGLSTVAMCAPSDKFLNWGGPLGIGLGGNSSARITFQCFARIPVLGSHSGAWLVPVLGSESILYPFPAPGSVPVLYSIQSQSIYTGYRP
ncbi:Growth hormone-inducible transmembrane protein [Armadillidium nasatum]|uniref:Growth hormone-inducible transmembrane protein n=1 Tax=Armadillidium nasatum TaxID=96803 RepID=A0A5N5TFD3_9CRUS|nr:Growth hormone-inducible transmembrane protein [Armadillidium nasatum]